MMISYHMGQLNGNELHPSAHILFKNKKKGLKKRNRSTLIERFIMFSQHVS